MICIVNISDLRHHVSRIAERLSDDSQKAWLQKAVLRHVMATKDCLLPTMRTMGRQDEVHVKRAIEKGQQLYRWAGDGILQGKITDIVDWLAGLADREPAKASRLHRMTFEHALNASKEWHRVLAVRAERADTKAIPYDYSNAPPVLSVPSLGDGWHWVWLRSPEARALEGDAMGHCIGSGSYEGLGPSKGVFSLRDPDHVPRVTMYLSEMEMREAVCKGNSAVAKRYEAAVADAVAVIGLRLEAMQDPTKVIEGDFRSGGKDYFVVNQRLHREDGAAMYDHSRPDSAAEHWFFEGKRHRDDGPAVTRHNLRKPWEAPKQMWYRHGEMHREGGPALLHGEKQEWWYDGQLHRDDGPAIIEGPLNCEYYQHGKLHRNDGPALVSPEQQSWYQNGEKHRADGPAIIDRLAEQWFLDGKRHRTDGPAIIMKQNDGNTIRNEWFLNGERHREDGPAIVVLRSDGDNQENYWLHGELIEDPSFGFNP